MRGAWSTSSQFRNRSGSRDRDETDGFIAIETGGISSSINSSSTTTTAVSPSAFSSSSNSIMPRQQVINKKMDGSNKLIQEADMMNKNNDDHNDMEPLLVGAGAGDHHPKNESSSPSTSTMEIWIQQYFTTNPEFFKQAFKFALCFCGLQASYLTWGYMQELIMTTQFEPTPRVPSGKFPSAAFCVFSNRFLAVLVALIAVRMKHGAVFSNNKAPLWAFTPCALSNTMSSWSQYASLKYVSFPVQTIFKSSKIIPVMVMGKVLKGTSYPMSQYMEAFLITIGVAVFSLLSKSPSKDHATEVLGLIFLIMYITFDSFTSQWQDKIYSQYGRNNVDQYQMMLGVNVSAIIITTTGLIITGDIPIVYEFLLANPIALRYNIITAITSASGQLCIFYTIKEFGPIVFTVIMTVRQMISICISAIVFGHFISYKAALGAILVFAVLFYQTQQQYYARQQKQQRGGGGSSRGG